MHSWTEEITHPESEDAILLDHTILCSRALLDLDICLPKTHLSSPVLDLPMIFIYSRCVMNLGSFGVYDAQYSVARRRLQIGDAKMMGFIGS